jgi:hypothetical protein
LNTLGISLQAEETVSEKKEHEEQGGYTNDTEDPAAG